MDAKHRISAASGRISSSLQGAINSHSSWDGHENSGDVMRSLKMNNKRYYRESFHMKYSVCKVLKLPIFDYLSRWHWLYTAVWLYKISPNSHASCC